MRIDTSPTVPTSNDPSFLAIIDRPTPSGIAVSGPCEELQEFYERKQAILERQAAEAELLSDGVMVKPVAGKGLSYVNQQIARLEKECAGERSTPKPVETTEPAQSSNTGTTPAAAPAPKPCGKCPPEDESQ